MKSFFAACIIITPLICLGLPINIINNSNQSFAVKAAAQIIDWRKPSIATSLCPPIMSTPSQCTIQITDGWRDNLTKGNEGEITLLTNSGSCQAHYHHTDNPFSMTAYKDTEVFSKLQCNGTLANYNFTYQNPAGLYADRPLDAFTESAENQASADCGQNSMNCLILSPPTEQVITALKLQAQLDQYEPLDAEQFIGGHNSAISPSYTNSKAIYNLSYSDPNASIDLPTQLNIGVRQIELDVEWDKPHNDLLICHNHVSDSPLAQDFLCNDNQTLAGNQNSPLDQIATWASNHPNDLIIIYFDVNEPIDTHLDTFNSEIASTIGRMVFTPADAQKLNGSTYLQTNRISANLLTHYLHKNIIITNDDGDDHKPDLGNSPWVFTTATPDQKPPLPEVSIEKLISNHINCTGNVNKYTEMNQLYLNPNHFHLLRVNADRTAINYMKDNKADYFTTANLQNYRACPINVFGINMLSASDPRLDKLLWSWEAGYPSNQGADIATINPNNQHFENNTLSKYKQYAVLCYHPSNTSSPTKALDWYTEAITIHDIKDAKNDAEKVCQYSNGLFAAPVTSYWVDDVLSMLNKNQNQAPVLINLINQNGAWIANDRSSLLLR